MIFNQYLDEADDEKMAQRLQEEMYGGGAGMGGGMGMGMPAEDLNVRKADSEVMDQLIGGPEPPRGHREHMRRPVQV